jgi:flavodoxin
MKSRREIKEVSKMKALVIYDSQYGNTEQVARAIAASLEEQIQVQIISARTASRFDVKDANLIAMGCPTQGHGLSPAMRALLERLPVNSLPGVPALAFDTRLHLPGWLSGVAAGQIARHLQRIGCRIILPHESFFVSGSEGPLVEGELERAAAWARRALELATLAEPTSV